MRKVFEVKASPWIGNRIVSTYKVCAKSSADAKAVIKKQPEINSFLYLFLKLIVSDFDITKANSYILRIYCLI